jgi:pimeloyl-ACP methyl ester carboxylesterase
MARRTARVTLTRARSDAELARRPCHRQFDALDRLSAITTPTLVVVGEQDLLTPPV